jgi:hypothetical protein
MKQKMSRDVSAFTRVELLVVIAVLMVVIVTMLLPNLAGSRKATRITCIFNLKEIGTGYRLWAGDHGDFMPPEQTVSNGGWKELLGNADQGSDCWTNYAIMANELGQSPKLLVCPEDTRRPAMDFAIDFKDNTHLSYFVGVSAIAHSPNSLLGGDRNLGPGTVPDPNYGYSPKNGKGNDVAVPISGPVSWSLKIHSEGNPAGAGNILLGDGSAQQVSSAGFVGDWLSHAEATTNWPASHIPSSPSIRLVFP